MNLVVIEEHQAGDLVFAQVYYLYILLEATSAYVILPVTIGVRACPDPLLTSYDYGTRCVAMY